MKKLKIILTSLFTMMMVACLSLGITSIVSAEVVPPAKTTAFEVVDGASIRLSEPTGLRFQIKLGQAEYEALVSNNAYVGTKSLGAIIVPDSFLTVGMTAAEIEALTKLDYEVTADKIFAEGGYYYANIVVVNVKYVNLNLKFNAVGYIKDSATTPTVPTVYTPINKLAARDVVYIASSAKADTLTEYTPENIKLFDKFIQLGINSKLGTAEATAIANFEAGTAPTLTVNLNKTETTILVGETETLTAVSIPEVNLLTKWSSSDTAVATVSASGIVTAKTVGTATITVEKYGATATTLVTVTAKPIVEAPKDAIANIEVRGAGNTTVDLTGKFPGETLRNISVEKGEKLGYTLENEKATITRTDLKSRGEKTLLVTTDKNIYKYNVWIADFDIKDIPSFTAFAEEYKVKGVNPNQTAGMYVMMTANVDLASVDAVALGMAAGRTWRGTFDGRGHSLSNLQTSNGLFATLGGNAVVKNLAIINATMQGNAGIIANEAYNDSTIENCFVKFRRPEGATKDCKGLVNAVQTDTVIIKNCIIDIESSVTTKALANSVVAGARKKIANSYAVSSTATHLYPDVTAGLYKTAAEFKAGFEGFVAGKNWAEQWRIEETNLYFGDNLVMDLRVEAKDISIKLNDLAFPETTFPTTAFDLTKLSASSVTCPAATYSWFYTVNGGAETALDIANTAMKFTEIGTYNIIAKTDMAGFKGIGSVEFVVSDKPIIDRTADPAIANLEVRAAGNTAIDLTGKLTNETLQSLSVENGENLSYALEGEKATITRTDLKSRGEKTLLVTTDKNIYKYNIWIADFDIKDIPSFTAFAAAYHNAKANGKTIGWFVMMTANVDLASVDAVALGMDAGHFWNGIFDGRGHSLSNLQTKAGLFAIIAKDAVVKNLAIINATMQGNGGIIANEAYNSAAVENCFVKFRRPAGATTTCNGMVNAVQTDTVIIKNCIIDIESSVTTKALANSVVAGARKKIANSYAVSSTATHLYPDVTAGLYKTPSAFNAAFEGFTAGKNWSEYWRVDGTNLYFGDNLVMDLTIAA